MGAKGPSLTKEEEEEDVEEFCLLSLFFRLNDNKQVFREN